MTDKYFLQILENPCYIWSVIAHCSLQISRIIYTFQEPCDLKWSRVEKFVILAAKYLQITY